MLIRYFYIFILFTFILWGCPLKKETDKTDTSQKYLRIRTNKDVYNRKGKEKITITAINISHQNLYYLSPGINASLQKLESGDWVDLGPWYDIIAIVPRKKTASPGDEIPIPPLPSGFERLKKTGQYRICLNLFTNPDATQSLNMEDKVSNTFEMVE
jgi:hypothetical protein